MARHLNVSVASLIVGALLQASCGHVSGGSLDDIELLPPRGEAWFEDYDRITLPCDKAPEYWSVVADEPSQCTFVPTLELWLRDAIFVDDKNRATLNRE